MFDGFYEVPGKGEANEWEVDFTTPDGTETARGVTKRHAVMEWGRAMLRWAGHPTFPAMFDNWLNRLRMTS